MGAISSHPRRVRGAVDRLSTNRWTRRWMAYLPARTALTPRALAVEELQRPDHPFAGSGRRSVLNPRRARRARLRLRHAYGYRGQHRNACYVATGWVEVRKQSAKPVDWDRRGGSWCADEHPLGTDADSVRGALTSASLRVESRQNSLTLRLARPRPPRGPTMSVVWFPSLFHVYTV